MKKGKRILSLLLVMVLLLLSAGNIIAAEVDTAAAETAPPSETDAAPSLEQDSTTEADPYRVYFRDLPGYTMPQPMTVSESILFYDTESLILDIVEEPAFLMAYLCCSSTDGLWYRTLSRNAGELFPQIVELNRREDAASVMVNMLKEVENVEIKPFNEGMVSSMLRSGVFEQQMYEQGLQIDDITGNITAVVTKSDLIAGVTTDELPIVPYPTEVQYAHVDYFETLDECRVDYYAPTARYSDEEYAAIDATLCYMFPENELISSGTHWYNCHSYAWYLQSFNNDRWINYPTGYINDDHCDRIDADQVAVGDRVIYYSQSGEPLHSAVVYSISGNETYFISKWGPYSVFVHELEDVVADYLDYGYGYCYYYRYPDDHTWDHEVTSENGHHCRCYTCGRTTVLPHTFTVSQHNAAVHVYECDECGYEYTEAHNMTAHGVCRKCGYSGFVIEPVTAIPSDDKDTEPCAQDKQEGNEAESV